MSLRAGKIILFVAMCGLTLLALYVSALTAQRHDSLHKISRYNLSWIASQASAEFVRLEERIAAAGIPGSDVDADEVQLRLDIIANRLNILDQGDFKDFADRDPESFATVKLLAETIKSVQPLVEKLDRPGSIVKALQLLSPLDPKLARLAASANTFGGERASADQRELMGLHNIFSIVVMGLLLCGFFLVGLLGWHNTLLERARSKLHKLAQDLGRASTKIELANDQIKQVNTELQARNEILLRRDRELGVQNRRFDAALNNMSHALCMVDASEHLVVYNERFAELFDLDFTPIPGMSFPDLVGLSANAGLAGIYRRQRDFSHGEAPMGFTYDCGEGRTISVSHQPMPDGGWVATYEDITERRRAEAQITYLAHHDALTGLFNRGYFQEQLQPALARADRLGSTVAVLCVDIDGFKDVNDLLGEAAGDVLLREIGARIRANAREGDVVARLDGDEFAVLQSSVDSAFRSGAMAERLIACLAEPFASTGPAVSLGASIGIALGPVAGGQADQLVMNAGLALERAKDGGGGTYRFFEADMDAERKDRRALESDLRRALVQGEFKLYFQPLVDVHATRILGFEALMRWSHPTRGMVPPTTFIPMAEEIGLISNIGEWVLREACATAATWPGSLSVAVNLSPAQFKNDLCETVRSALAETGLAPSRLELEITESVLLYESEGVLQALHDLRALGIRIAMDDFGTGYSSLSYLRSFPFDKIKIDQSFVRELSVRPDCIKIVGSITALAASLGITTTAEGVETPDQLEQLRSIGCDQVQGYLFARPQPAEELRFSLAGAGLPEAAAA